jgi:hypothetical protein
MIESEPPIKAPTVGRIVHLSPLPADEWHDCRAALVTGIDYRPVRVFYATAWSKDARQSYAKVSIEDTNLWHDPRFCPFAGQSALGPGPDTEE